MTSPPLAPAHGLRSEPARPAAITRILQTDDLPDGVDALASVDGKTIIVRRSLDQLRRRRAMREVMMSIRRYPRPVLYPAISVEAIRQLSRRIIAGAPAYRQAQNDPAAAAFRAHAGYLSS